MQHQTILYKHMAQQSTNPYIIRGLEILSFAAVIPEKLSRFPVAVNGESPELLSVPGSVLTGKAKWEDSGYLALRNHKSIVQNRLGHNRLSNTAVKYLTRACNESLFHLESPPILKVKF